MSPSAVLSADKPGNNSGARRVAMMATGQERCIPPSVPLVAKIRKCPLSLRKIDLCTAAIATLKSGEELRFSKGNTEEEEKEKHSHPLLFSINHPTLILTIAIKVGTQ
jgi:hypothetical protein